MTIRDKIIAFNKEGEMVVFESKMEFDVTYKKGLDITHIFASPSVLYRKLVNLEEANESMKSELLRKEKQPNKCEEIGEAAVRRLKAQEDGSQRKMRGVM